MSTVPFHRSRTAPLPPDLAKKLPSNLDAEKSILGSVMLDEQVPNAPLKIAREILTPEDFFLQEHRRIFRNMLFLADSLHPIDLVSLEENLTTNRELEAAGGAPYLASLLDGIPRVSNTGYYAKLVRDKAMLRNLIHATQNIQQRALDADDQPEIILANANEQIAAVQKAPSDNPAVVVGWKSLLTRECAPIQFAIEPLLSNRGTGEIYGWRGAGKSMTTQQMAFDISTNRPLLWDGHKGGGGHWPVNRPFRILYVYGEMDESEIQERAQMITLMRGREGVESPTDEQLGSLCMDFQKDWRPKICSARDRKFIEQRLFSYGYEMLILDNISTLWPSSTENQTDRSALLAEWFTDLNQRRVCVIFLHHAGKSGEQRGDSEKEDMLSFVLKLKKPANYKEEEQLRLEVRVEKNRHKAREPRLLLPFELQLGKNAQCQPEWFTKPARAAQRMAAFENFKNAMPASMVGEAVGVSHATIFRWKKEYLENSDPKHWLDKED